MAVTADVNGGGDDGGVSATGGAVLIGGAALVLDEPARGSSAGLVSDPQAAARTHKAASATSVPWWRRPFTGPDYRSYDTLS